MQVTDEFLAGAHHRVHVCLEVLRIGVVDAGEDAEVVIEFVGVFEEGDEVATVNIDGASFSPPLSLAL